MVRPSRARWQAAGGYTSSSHASSGPPRRALAQRCAGAQCAAGTFRAIEYFESQSYSPAMNLTLRDLEAFLGVARFGSFTRAARSLNMSQPALTVRIHHLEDALGVRLIDRTTR